MTNELSQATPDEADCMPSENPQFFLTPAESCEATSASSVDDFRARWWPSEGFVDSERSRLKVKKPR